MKLGTIGHYFTGRVCMTAIVVQSWLVVKLELAALQGVPQARLLRRR